MNHRRSLPALTLVFALAVSACGALDSGPGGTPAPTDGADPSLDGAWVLTEAVVDGAAVALDGRYRVTMTIAGSEIGGRAACNHYGGSVAVDGGSLTVGPLGHTEMACEPAVMEVEAAFLEGLRRVTTATRSGATAELGGEGVELAFELLPEVPTAALTGVTWVLDTIIEGETTVSTSAGVEPATLLLRDDGTLGGNTGCRALRGEYAVSGDTVVFTSFAADGECPQDLAWQDGRVVTVLGDGFTVAIEGDRLTLTAAGGEALSYRAGP